MGKSNKPIFTEDMTKYKDFLSVTNEGLAKAAEEICSQIESRQKIIEIIQKYQDHHTVASKDLAELAKISCPDFHSLDAIIDKLVYEQDTSNASYSSINESYRASINCAGKTCTECWKDYINATAHLLNVSPVDIKNLSPEEDK